MTARVDGIRAGARVEILRPQRWIQGWEQQQKGEAASSQNHETPRDARIMAKKRPGRRTLRMEKRMRCKRLVCALGIAMLVSAAGGARAQSADKPAPKLPAVIPVFPLEVAMLFPGVSRPLYIFEPRYRAMVADALKGDRIIGMTTLKPGYEADYAGRPPIYEIGCAGVITDVEELSGGRFNIVLRGLVKFRVTGEDNSRPYRLARVDVVPEVLDERRTGGASQAARAAGGSRDERWRLKGAAGDVRPRAGQHDRAIFAAGPCRTTGAARAENRAPPLPGSDRSDRIESGFATVVT